MSDQVRTEVSARRPWTTYAQSLTFVERPLMEGPWSRANQRLLAAHQDEFEEYLAEEGARMRITLPELEDGGEGGG